MIGIQDISQWKGAPVVGPDGGKIGTLESVYVDAATDEPMFAAVRLGLPGMRKIALVPLDGARVGRSDLQVPYDKGQIKNSPTLAVDEELPAEREPEIYAHYQLGYTPAPTSSGRRLARR
ncbi:photosystem reaction center subunit H [Actinocatenispora thailandica]|uniref:Photosystem reaction center subunit H n=1 Tax=Actinocatenispora thailandica TaxID=227318 RepID=A0A7R7DMI5_9ACTN|nr:PRC-barrel domain-containing protein [Actinocatenispora thailandica]BCJ34465.1 photosystem reaction center subunit H [Actinocatenispora thailandica]